MSDRFENTRMLTTTQVDRLLPRLNSRELSRVEASLRAVAVARERAKGYPRDNVADWIMGRILSFVWWARWWQLAWLLARFQRRHAQ